MKYFHLRYCWTNYITPTNPNGVDCRGGVTIGVEYGHTPTSVKFALAFCNVNDVYCRRIGRNIVEGRIHNKDYYEVDIGPDDDWGDFIEKYVKPIIINYLERVHQEESNLYIAALT